MNCSFCGKAIKDYALSQVTKCISCNDDICGKCSDAGSMYCARHSQKTKIDDITDYNCSHSGCGATIIPPERYCPFHKKFAELPASAKMVPKPQVSFKYNYSTIDSEPPFRPKYYDTVSMHSADSTMPRSNSSIYDDIDEFMKPTQRVERSPLAEIPSYRSRWLQPKLTQEEIKSENEAYVLRLETLMGNIPDDFKKYVEEEIKKTRESPYIITKYQQDCFMSKAQNSMSDYLDAEEKSKKVEEVIPEPDNIVQSTNIEDLDKIADEILTTQQKREDDRNLVNDIAKKLQPEQTRILTKLDNIYGKLTAQASTQTRLVQSIESIYSRLAVIEQVLCIKQPVTYAQNYAEQGAVMSIHALTDRLANLESSTGICKKLLQDIVKDLASEI